MAKFQVITNKKGKPVFAVLPYGDQEAFEDYIDALWAEKAVEEFEAKPDKCFYDWEDDLRILSIKNRNENKP